MIRRERKVGGNIARIIRKCSSYDTLRKDTGDPDGDCYITQ